MQILHFLCICICMSDNWDHWFWCHRTIIFLKIYHIVGISVTCSIFVIVFVRICICTSDKWILCLRSSYLFKNIAHVGPLCNFYRSCICVFAGETLGNIVFEVLVPQPFKKYNIHILGKPHGTISAVQMDFVQIAFQPPPPQATGPFGATFFAEN